MEQILLGRTAEGVDVCFISSLLNRHGLIAGATGTGKTVTLQVLAEQFSRLGIPVLLTDIKGDLSGVAKAGILSEKVSDRLKTLKDLAFTPVANAVNFIDVFGKKGHPLRVTPSEMGPVLLSRLLELNETQEGVVHIAFKYADSQGLFLLDLKDLQSVFSAVAENADELRAQYGNVSAQSVGAIQRRLLVLEDQGGLNLFGEPLYDINDLLVRDFSGKGLVQILDSTDLLERPRLYASLLLWLLSELYESLEEVGDLALPKLVLFFDEAHLLFEDMPKALGDRIETIIRLIRSKGVGVFFITQSPDDIPPKILAQLGNRVQHALRAFTQQDESKISKISKTFRAGAGLDIEKVITALQTGEALVSPLNEKGEPMPVVRTLIRPPESKIGPITEEERNNILSSSMFMKKYKDTLDRESAFEVLKKRAAALPEEKEETKDAKNESGGFFDFGGIFSSSSKRQTPVEAFVKTIVRTVGSQIGRQITRGVLGTLSKR